MKIANYEDLYLREVGRTIELQIRIDKAIKFLSDEDIEVASVKYNDINDVTNELIEILKGENDEHR